MAVEWGFEIYLQRHGARDVFHVTNQNSKIWPHLNSWAWKTWSRFQGPIFTHLWMCHEIQLPQLQAKTSSCSKVKQSRSNKQAYFVMRNNSLVQGGFLDEWQCWKTQQLHGFFIFKNSRTPKRAYFNALLLTKKVWRHCRGYIFGVVVFNQKFLWLWAENSLPKLNT